MLLHFFDCSHCRVVSRSVVQLGIDWTDCANGARVPSRLRKNGTLVSIDDLISIFQLLSEATSSGTALSFLDRMITATSCCLLHIQNRAPPNAGGIAAAAFVRKTHQHRLLENTQDRQKDGMATAFTRFPSNKEY